MAVRRALEMSVAANLEVAGLHQGHRFGVAV